jgi:predicted nucleotidyltransferase
VSSAPGGASAEPDVTTDRERDVAAPDEPPPPIIARPNEWRIVTNVLREFLPACEVWAFGSRARGRPKPYSDLDLAIVSDSPLSIDRLAELAEAFSESDLPWKVDLIDWARTSPEFQARIAAEKVIIQQATANK